MNALNIELYCLSPFIGNRQRTDKVDAPTFWERR
jgi:hypothetical protein